MNVNTMMNYTNLLGSSTKIPMTEKVCSLLISLNIASSSYDSILFYIDDACAYLNDLLISMTSEAAKQKAKIYDSRNKVEEKNSRIEALNFKLKNVTLYRDSVRINNNFVN